MPNTDWYAPLRDIASKGQIAPRATRLGDLAARRAVTQGQHFTPEAVAALIGRLLSPAMDNELTRRGGADARLHLLDTSMGSGRLFSWCDPQRHTLWGFDIDGEAVARFERVAIGAGFSCNMREGCLEHMSVARFDCALVNPPFSINLRSPLLERFESNAFGRFGPKTSALSHVYALDQALDAASVVVAILPRTFADDLVFEGHRRHKRLLAVYDLPASTFRDEGAEVSTSICVYGGSADPTRCVAAPARHRVSALDAECPPIPALSMPRLSSAPKMHAKGISPTEPTIATPITGDSTVRVAHAGRRLVVRYRDGLTEARVQNAILRHRLPPPAADDARRPRSIRFDGQGALDLELYVAQPDPLAAWESLLKVIRAAGGEPNVDPGIVGYLRNRAKRIRAQTVPFHHMISAGETAAAAGVVPVRALRRQLLDPMDWRSPIIQSGDKLEATRSGAEFTLSHAGVTITLDERSLRARFAVGDASDSEAGNAGWRELHPGRAKTFPRRAAAVRARIDALGIPAWFSWGYQVDDLVELLTVPSNAIVAWAPALGKTRLAAALALYHGGRSLAVLEPHVLDEFERQLAELPLPEGFVRVIRSADDIPRAGDRSFLALITYNRLRQRIPGTKVTYAQRLRRRVHQVIADEGHRLGNPQSEQTRAMHALAARRRFALTGTPIQNLPRDTLWLMQWSHGDGGCLQPFGIKRPMFEPRLLASMNHAVRGLDAFRDRFVATEWVSNEFKEDLTKGAKREIPVLRNESAFREWLAPALLRRVKAEPAVAPYFQQAEPTVTTHVVPWDRQHLEAYLTTCENFAQWYREAMRDAAEKGRALNLTSILARVGACEAAASHPHHPREHAIAYAPVTSKQRAIVDHIVDCVATGDAVIAFFHSPALVKRMAALLADRGQPSVMLHGGIGQRERTTSINTLVRTRRVPVTLATFGTTKTGLNLPEINRVVLGDRAWTPMVEDQAVQRVMRCQQTRHVHVDVFELAGSIDSYKAQMVASKRSANSSAIDAIAQDVGAEFVHLDSILYRFLQATAMREGMTMHEWRDELRMEQAAA